MSHPTGPESEPIGLVREGMEVIDATGQHLGTVEMVQLSDPGADTSQGEGSDLERDPSAEQSAVPPVIAPVAPGSGFGATTGMGAGGVGGGGPGAMVGAALTRTGGDDRDAEPDVPPSLAQRLRRTGYVKVESKGLFRRDLYISADQIADVNGGVQLSTTKAELIKED